MSTTKALSDRAKAPGIDRSDTYWSGALTHSVHVQDRNVDPHEKLNGAHMEQRSTRESNLHTIQAKSLTNLAQDQAIGYLKLPRYRLPATIIIMDQLYNYSQSSYCMKI